MFISTDYIIDEKIYENIRIKVFKGKIKKNKASVIIKVLKKEASNPYEITKFIHEFNIAYNLEIEGIINPIKLEQEGNKFAIIMNDVKGIPLRDYLKINSIDLKAFLDIAVQLVEILGKIHQKGILHRDIKPENILIEPKERKVYIIDFSSASSSDLENNTESNSLLSNKTVGTLEYMSPEHTGLLNQTIDQRSDLYSLGVVFYEMITGQLPLKIENIDNKTNAHITKKPLPPKNINSNCLLVISDIIMKLLEKDPNDRYQNTYGLMFDIKKCVKELNEKGSIEPFFLGGLNMPINLEISEKLYGREEEKEVIKKMYLKAREGKKSTIIVKGSPGIGKTKLVNESIKSIIDGRGYFISGKFDQLEQNIPYSPFAFAFGSLIRQLITESPKRLNQWEKRIKKALGRNGGVITEIIPELEMIIGKQPSSQTLPPKEAENRFLLVIRDFIRIFTRKDNPLVLFIDDLQWADHASVNLLDYLVRDTSLHSFLLIGAVRENEVNKGHPITKILKEKYSKKLFDEDIALLPLNYSQAAGLISESLHMEQEKTSNLTEILYRKSGGNPFYLGQFLYHLYEEDLLYYDIEKGFWKWEIESIKMLQVGEEVLELLLKKIRRLPDKTLNILKIAACIGNRFKLEVLGAVSGKTIEEIELSLKPALEEKLILSEEIQNNNIESFTLEFLHDRIQQAIYSLIPEDHKKVNHINIGRILMKNIDGRDLEEKILPIMDHFNRGLELVNDLKEKSKLASYNLMAGKKAKGSGAHNSALYYFISGKALLPKNQWEVEYQLAFELHLEHAQAEYLSGNVELAEELFDTVIKKARNEVVRSSIKGMKMELYAGIGNYDKAVQTGIEALRKMGVRVPLYPKKIDFIKELLIYKWNMKNKKIEALLDLPEMTEPKKRSIAELFTRLASVTVSSYPDLYSFVFLKICNYGIKNGNTNMIPVGYAGYGIIAGNILGDYKAGEKIGKVCIQLAEKYDKSSSKCIIYLVIGAFISHWTQEVSIAVKYLKKAELIGLEAGDVLIIGFAHCFILDMNFFQGVSLRKLAKEIREKQEIAYRLKHDSLAINTVICGKVVSTLLGKEKDSLERGAINLEKDSFLQSVNEKDQSALATIYFYKTQLCYMAGNHKEALSAAGKVHSLIDSILGFMLSSEHIFYYSLSITAHFKEMNSREKKRYWRILKKNQKQMKKWSENCKENFFHKYLLVNAEIARIKNKDMDAMSLYDKSIKSARENKYIQNEALANELAGKFYLEKGNEKVAKTYMLDSCSRYNLWGALSKIKELKSKYSSFLEEVYFEEESENMADLYEKEVYDSEISESLPRISSSSDDESLKNLNGFAVNKLIEDTSKDVSVNNMMDSFLDIAINKSGATRGFLILEKNGELFIEAVKDLDIDSKIASIESIPLEECDNLPKGIVRYVTRTLETIIINCGEETGIFDEDPYIKKMEKGSIACMPLSLHSMPIGVLYLENKLVKRLFNNESMEILQLLSKHLAYAKKMQSYFKENKDKPKGEKYSKIIEPLTEREKSVLTLIANGMSNKEISDELKITINTVKGYIKNIYDKLGVNRRVKAVTRAKELNILKD